MKPIPSVFLESQPEPLIAPGEQLVDVLAGLAARMSATQRHAFLTKMSSLDQQGAGASLWVTLGSA